MVQNTVIQMETLKLEQIDQQKQALRFHQMIDALPQVRMKQSWIARAPSRFGYPASGSKRLSEVLHLSVTQ